MTIKILFADFREPASRCFVQSSKEIILRGENASRFLQKGNNNCNHTAD